MKQNITLTILGQRSNLTATIKNTYNRTRTYETNDWASLCDGLTTDAYNVLVLNNFINANSKNGDDCNYEEYIHRSLSVTAKMISIIKKKDVKIDKVIYSSSAVVYENSNSTAVEQTVASSSFHSIMKLAAEKIVYEGLKDVNTECVIARIFNMFGGEDRFSIVHRMIEAAKGDTCIRLYNNGASIRDFIHVENVADIYVKLAHPRHADIKTVNIGTGRGVTVREILEVAQKCGYSLQSENEYRQENPRIVADLSALTKLIGYFPMIDVLDYIRKTLERYKRDHKVT